MRSDGVYILFEERAGDDRLGAHCLHILVCIVLSHKLDVGIHFIKGCRLYSDTIFMKTILKYISNWNKDRPKKLVKTLDEELDCYKKTCNYSLYHITTILCESDVLTYYRTHIKKTMMEYFNQYELEMDYSNINKDAIQRASNKNNICIHLRLDDLEDYTFDYDSKRIRDFFNDHIFTGIENTSTITVLFHKYLIKTMGANVYNRVIKKYCSKSPVFSYMGQSVVDSRKLQTIIDNNSIGNEIVVITSPSGEVKLDKYHYYRLSSTQETDLYILCKTTNLILSRSTYALVSLFFNINLTNAWVHEWGISLAMGLNTKYDKNNYNYF
jgi:hypothetical protein